MGDKPGDDLLRPAIAPWNTIRNSLEWPLTVQLSRCVRPADIPIVARVEETDKANETIELERET